LPEPGIGNRASGIAGTRLIARIAGAAVAAHRATLSIHLVHEERFLDLDARKVPILFALWHGRMLVPIQEHRDQGIVTMASQSKDGELIARWLERIGYSVARGSSSRGGSSALRDMVRHVRAGRHAALTVDGPRGPARVVQPGVLQLARLTRAWILPITSSSARPRFLASWDRYLVPLPFSRTFVVYGEPFPVDASWSDEEGLARIAASIDTATAEADRIAGITPPEVWTRKPIPTPDTRRP
jgi:lysophospholipid acyltransferase (LPLAT)-like uncharacterized protein